MSQYERRRTIGRGASGIVYEAVDIFKDDVVALKVFFPGAGFPKYETSLASKVTHENVCRVFHCFIDEDRSACVAMEYVDGGTLERVIEQSGARPPDECLPLFRQFLKGVAAIHDAGVVHRDLKPSNVLLTSDGKIKIGDFGHACRIGTPTDLEHDQFAGTPPYAAPEQTMSGRICDARTDIYAAGIILQAMLSGRAFTDPSEIVPIPGVPEYVEAAIIRATSLDPVRRFKSVGEFEEALEKSGVEDESVEVNDHRGAVLVIIGLVALGLAIAGNWVVRDYGRPVANTVGSSPIDITPRADAAVPDKAGRPPDKRPIQRVAVIDFENLTGDESLNPFSLGIAEAVSTELGNLHNLTLVDRTAVAEASRRLQIATTGSVREIGREIGADALISGSFQKLGDKVQLVGRVFDVNTGDVIHTCPPVDGTYNDLFKLQATLAKELAAGIQTTLSQTDRSEMEKTAAAGHSIEAFRAFSEGLFFLRQDLAADALKRFERTLALDPTYPGAQYYQGETLSKLQRPDEAIEALKSALPNSESDHPLLWTWDLPASTTHGLIRAVDNAKVHIQANFFRGEKQVNTFQKQILYGERTKTGTALHFLDSERHSFRRQELGDPFIKLNGTGFSNGRLLAVSSFAPPSESAAGQVSLYMFMTDGSRLSEVHLTDYGRDDLVAGFLDDALYIYLPGLRRLELVNPRTGKTLWSHDGIQVDGNELPLLRDSRAHGKILIFKSGDTYRAIRMANGTEVWSVSGLAENTSDLASDRLLILFESDRRILTVDLESGKPVDDIAIPPFADKLPTPYGAVWFAGAVLEGNTLYVLSKDMQLCAIDLTTPALRVPRSGGVVVWKTPIGKRIQSIRIHRNTIYLGTGTGDLIRMNTAGTILTTTSLTMGFPVAIEYAGDDVVLLNSAFTLHALTPEGTRLWSSPVRLGHETTRFKGLVTAYASDSQIFAVEAATGKMLWQYTGAGDPWPYIYGDRLFVAGADGVKEYSAGPKKEGISDREVLTELARIYLAKGDVQQATMFADRVADIDPNYPEASLVRSQLFQAQGNTGEAATELARYASLVGMDSKGGQQAIVELRRQHRLLWEATNDPDVAGDPIVMEKRVVSVGRRTAYQLHIDALDVDTGASAWRYGASRFVASVAGPYENSPVLWYVTADSDEVVLYRIDVRSGERKLLASWRLERGVDTAWIAHASGHIFVGTASADVNTKTLQINVDCFDAGSGRRLWGKVHSPKPTVSDLARPIRIFRVQDDTLTYAVGKERWTVRGTDGAALPVSSPVVETEHVYQIRAGNTAVEVDPKTGKVVASQRLLWRPSSFRFQSGRFYAFTADGHAYAVSR